MHLFSLLCAFRNNETCLDSTINERIQYLCNGKSFCQFEVDIDSDLFASCHTCDTLTVPLLQLEYKCVQNFETSNETCEGNSVKVCQKISFFTCSSHTIVDFAQRNLVSI